MKTSDYAEAYDKGLVIDCYCPWCEKERPFIRLEGTDNLYHYKCEDCKNIYPPARIFKYVELKSKENPANIVKELNELLPDLLFPDNKDWINKNLIEKVNYLINRVTEFESLG